MNKSVDFIKVGIMVHPPYSLGVNYIDTPNPGFSVELVKLFCNTFSNSIRCQYEKAENNMYGTLINGAWVGMVANIADGKYDISHPNFDPNEHRFRMIDFALPIMSSPIILVTRRPDHFGSNVNLLNSLVFHWKVWLTLICLSLHIGLFMSSVQMARLNSKWIKSVFTNCINSFDLLSGQSSFRNVTLLSARFLLIFWAVAVLILSGIYSGTLVSSLLRRNQYVLPFGDFDTFVRCVEKFRCRLIIDKNSLSKSPLQKIFYSETEIYIKLRNALEYNKPLICDTMKEIFPNISLEKNIYLVGLMTQVDYLIESDLNKGCQYKWVHAAYSNMQSFPMKKNSFLKERLNLFSSYVVQSGLWRKIYSKYYYAEQECEMRNVLGENLKPINILNFFGCLFILIMGISIASGALLCELTKFWISKKYIMCS